VERDDGGDAMKAPSGPHRSGGSAHAALAGAGRSLRALLGWLPLALALGLFAQLSLRGLRPALAERERLLRCEAELGARLADALAERASLEAFDEALDDPIYLERLRLERGR
jgi:hypothetical protein